MSDVIKFTESSIKELLIKEASFYAFSVVTFPSPESLQAYQRGRGILETLVALFGEDVIEGIRERTSAEQFSAGAVSYRPENVENALHADRVSHASSVASIIDRLKSAAGDARQVMSLKR